MAKLIRNEADRRFYRRFAAEHGAYHKGSGQWFYRGFTNVWGDLEEVVVAIQKDLAAEAAVDA